MRNRAPGIPSKRDSSGTISHIRTVAIVKQTNPMAILVESFTSSPLPLRHRRYRNHMPHLIHPVPTTVPSSSPKSVSDLLGRCKGSAGRRVRWRFPSRSACHRGHSCRRRQRTFSLSRNWPLAMDCLTSTEETRCAGNTVSFSVSRAWPASGARVHSGVVS